MCTDVEITRSAIQYLSGESELVCRLCLSSVESKGFGFDEQIMVKRSYFNETITFTDMLIEMNISFEEPLPQVLCKECGNTLLNSYLFRKLCQYSDEKWTQVLDTIEAGLEDASNISPSAKTLYLVVNRTKNVLYTSKQVTVKNKKNILSKFKSICKRKQYYNNYAKKHRIMSKYSNDNDDYYGDEYGSEEYTDCLCTKCGLSFRTEYLLNKHMHNSHKGRHACHKCGKVFLSKQQVKGHIERIHKPKKLKCPICEKLFSTNSLLHNHHQMHHIAVNCKLCYLRFPSKYVLRQHLDKHDMHKCPKCKKSYNNKNTYKFHLKICGNIEEKTPKFFCDLCPSSYVRKNGLRTHLKVDHGFGKVLNCSWCPKKFDAISKLKMHIVKHTKEKNFKCDVCGGGFVTQAALIYHNRLHTGERPFPCDLCDEWFLSASRRMEHKKRKHFGPTLECQVCHVKFVLNHQLKKHVERHSNPLSKLYVPKMESQNHINDPSVLE